MARPRSRMLASWVAVALAATSLGVYISGFGRAAADPFSAAASGALRISTSGQGAILSASDLAPGESARGAVTIADRGSAPATLVLSALNLVGGGGGGASLAGALQLTVRDVTRGSDGILYAGPLAGLGALRAGALAPGERRRYSFTATLPDPGLGVVDNALAGTWTEVDFGWRLTRASRSPCATRLAGDAAANRILGTVGGDRIVGGPGADRIAGGAGADCLHGGAGRDRLSGGPGIDTIYARDGAADSVACGPGEDLAVVDRQDRVRGCEHLRR
ncbi:MAG: hypothetical protein U0R71_13915 [Solirubrobacterales bacterium]